MNKELSIYPENEVTAASPMIVFTSFNINESKVRVWGENVNTDFNKLFNAIDLIAKIDGVLSNRKLLIKKKPKKINIWQEILNLPEQEMLFIKKLKRVIRENYQYSVFGKTRMASLLAVSERHLNRKAKKIIGYNPIDVLRDYRLIKAAKILRQGVQVGIVSDLCGFSSSSYFSSCFKKKFALSPKEYQIKRLLRKRKSNT